MSFLARKRREGIKLIESISDKPADVLLIHYSCENFKNRPDGRTAKITSIAVRYLSNATTTSFAIHKVAEEKGIAYKDVANHYVDLEKVMLQEFYDFVYRHRTWKWIHWNMRDINYGFPAIAHRFKVLGGNPIEIPQENLIDLARLVVSIYGLTYIEHPRLPSLIAKNSISDLGLLSGEDEAKSFDACDYISLHRSTLRKVDIFETIIYRSRTGTLKTNYRWRDVYGKSAGDFVIWLKEHPAYSAVGMIMLIAGVIKLGLQIYDWLK